MWLRLRDDPVVFSRKELESMVFVKEEFLHKNIQKKEDVFGDLTGKLTERKIVWNNMEACEGYKVIQWFDKVYS